mmetsp:Transcript_50980/g.147119  ORF Transcript_50980/g.147119 Transcript_50980/m.147119 type:complete len:249 (-) Transcript_50980:644-1390(-)
MLAKKHKGIHGAEINMLIFFVRSGLRHEVGLRHYTTAMASPSELVLDSLGESNGLIDIIEDGVVFSHEDVSKDPLRAGSREVHTHECKETCSLRLDDSLVSRDGILVATNLKDNIGDSVQSRAVNSVFAHNVGLGAHGGGQFRNLRLGSCNQRRSGINNGSNLIRSFLLVFSGFNTIQSDLPVSSSVQLNKLQIPLKLGAIIASKGKFTRTVVSQVKGKDRLVDLVLTDQILERGDSAIDTDGSEAQP